MTLWTHSETPSGLEVVSFLNNQQAGPGAVVSLNSRSTFDVWGAPNTRENGKEWKSHGRISLGTEVQDILSKYKPGEVVVSLNSDKSWDVFTYSG